MSLTTMVFDIETIGDVASGRRLLPELTDAATEEEVKQALIARRVKQTQGHSDFLPLHLHRIVAISVVVSTPTWVKIWSLGEEESEEADLIERFFAGLQKYTPVLVSWNGSGFDLPVLHYRALLHGIKAPRYWETGEKNSEFKWNNYLGRYHQRHTDIMDVLANYQSRAYAPLEEIALMLGLPGKMGMDGKQVWDRFEAGDYASIRNYCETDVLNTYLIYLRFQWIRGLLEDEGYAQAKGLLKELLMGSEKAHLLEFAKAAYGE